MKNYRPSIFGLLFFACVACASNVPPAESVVAQSTFTPATAPVVVKLPAPAAPVVEQPSTPAQPAPAPPPARIEGEAKLPAGTFGYFNWPIKPPEGGTVEFSWTCTGADAGRKGFGSGPDVMLTAPVGEYDLIGVATIKLGNWSLTLEDRFHFQYGEPKPDEPEKPLSELAGKDAAALRTFYEITLANLHLFPKVGGFLSDHEVGLKIRGLENNGARAVIAARLQAVLGSDAGAALDQAKVKPCLESIIKGLGPPPDGPKPSPVTTATRAVYIYEKDSTAIPAAVQSGIDKLNREKKIRATIFEEDTVDGSGEVPDQYRVPLAEALKAGLPALVFTNGETVLAVIKAPTTEAQVLEAIR